jgi:hypothetical protein
LCVYVCVCMCMYVCVYVCVCMYMCVCVCMCVCMCMYVYVCVYVCMYVYVCMCVYLSEAQIRVPLPHPSLKEDTISVITHTHIGEKMGLIHFILYWYRERGFNTHLSHLYLKEDTCVCVRRYSPYTYQHIHTYTHTHTHTHTHICPICT